MKYAPYIVAILLVIVWGIIFWKFAFSGIEHILLVAAALIILIQIIFRKQLSKRPKI